LNASRLLQRRSIPVPLRVIAKPNQNPTYTKIKTPGPGGRGQRIPILVAAPRPIDATWKRPSPPHVRARVVSGWTRGPKEQARGRGFITQQSQLLALPYRLPWCAGLPSAQPQLGITFWGLNRKCAKNATASQPAKGGGPAPHGTSFSALPCAIPVNQTVSEKANPAARPARRQGTPGTSNFKIHHNKSIGKRQGVERRGH